MAHRIRSTTAGDEAAALRPPAERPVVVNSNPSRLLQRAVSWGKRQLRVTTQRLERRRLRAHARPPLESVQRLVLFVGNARSGTTLVRSLLDAHPNVVLGNEVNVLECLSAGEDWPTVAARIFASAEGFRQTPVWEGYGYDVCRNQAQSPVLVIGDKKAAASARALMKDLFLLDRVAEWSQLPVRIVHCVRNPFDVITTKTMRNGRTLGRNTERYFEAEHTAAYLRDQLGSQCIRIHLEDLIAEPEAALASLLTALDLSADRDYFDNCKAVIFDRPSTTRDKQPWPPDQIADVARRAAECEHLSRYVPARGGEA